MRAIFTALLIGVLLTCAAPAATATELIDSINVLRTRGCSGAAGASNRLRRTNALDEVAQAWSKGGRLQAALERESYRARNSSSMRVSGTKDDQRILQMLSSNYCRIVTDATFTDIGIHRRGDDVWMVVAAPLALPAVKDANAVARDVLGRVNAARARARKCGAIAYPAAPPLTLSTMLSRAALIHAQDMASHEHFEHEGTDGSTPAQRVTRVGYRWRTVAENIAAGADTAAIVVDGWVASPGHCSNIMGVQYREMGIAFSVNEKSDAGIYWSQVFGTER